MGKRGFTSFSVGGRGATLNLGKRGVKSTISLPGTGLSYQHRFKAAQIQQSGSASPNRWKSAAPGFIIVMLLAGGYLVFHSPKSSTPTPSANAVLAPVEPANAGPIASNFVTGGEATPTATRQPVVTSEPSFVIRQVITIQANVRAAPSLSAPVVEILEQGRVLRALRSENGWTRVSEQDGRPIGWMHNSVLK